MILINRDNYPCPNSLLEEGAEEVDRLILLLNANREQFINTKSKDLFKSDIYASDDVKDSLIKSQKGKCAFCESTIHEVSYSHVEHYRPKAGWKANANSVVLNSPGYFKDAYNYNNLLLACGVCNVSYKKNYFPLSIEDVRAEINVDYDNNLEEPLLINPVVTEPNEHIDFYKEFPLGRTISGNISIEYYGLDRQPLNDKRLEKYNLLSGYVRMLNKNPHDEDLKLMLKEQLDENIENNLSYVAMVKANFKEYLGEN